MTSSSTFVFVQLPDSGEIVVAGRYELSDDQVGSFVYGRSYLGRPNAIALDPRNLPLTSRLFRTTWNGGLFGALRDAAPDAWGRLIMERTGSPANELDYLLATSDTRVGALSFGPTAEPPALDLSGALPLDNIAPAVEAADGLQAAGAGEGNASTIDPRLLHPGSSLGGARPKATVVDSHGQLWVAKFPALRDPWDHATVERGYLLLAARCGIEVPESRVIQVQDRRVLLVKRFDQEPGGVRRPYLSAHSALGLDSGVVGAARAGWSYNDLAHVLRAESRHPREDAHQLFRRAVFNALTSNEDDHPRNHALIWRDGGWSLSPAYDLTPSTTRSPDERRFAMRIGRLEDVDPRLMRRSVLVSGAEDFLLSPEEADRIIDQMKETVVSSWRVILERAGATRTTTDLIEHAFPTRYPGFEYGRPS